MASNPRHGPEAALPLPAEQPAPASGPAYGSSTTSQPQRTSATSTGSQLDGVVLDGRYRLDGLIGQGGMATVHAARDLLLNRDVAIKLFRTRATRRSDMRAQEAEARVIASMNHYALTTLFDAGIEAADTDAPQIYLVMEHVASDLRARLRQGTLSVVETSWLGFDLSEALDYVHQAGFLHRDIKPANVLLSTLQSAKPIVGELADFGIASLVGEADTSEYTTGTAAYLSPEQVEGHDAGPASDVYSLGLVLLECLTGSIEYPGTVEESAFTRLDRDPHIPDDLPDLVAGVLRGMTVRHPEDRISLSATALQLQQHLLTTAPSVQQPDDQARSATLRTDP